MRAVFCCGKNRENIKSVRERRAKEERGFSDAMREQRRLLLFLLFTHFDDDCENTTELGGFH